MTNTTYTLHAALIRLAKGMLQAWETWLLVSSGSIELPRPDLASRSIPARQTVETATQSSVRANDRHARSTVEK